MDVNGRESGGRAAYPLMRADEAAAREAGAPRRKARMTSAEPSRPGIHHLLADTDVDEPRSSRREKAQSFRNQRREDPLGIGLCGEVGLWKVRLMSACGRMSAAYQSGMLLTLLGGWLALTTAASGQQTRDA